MGLQDRLGAFKAQDKITRPSDPTATSSLPSQAQERTRPLSTNGMHYSNASFVLKSEGSQPSITEIECDSSTAGGRNRRPSQIHNERNSVPEFRHTGKQTGMKSGNGRTRRPARVGGQTPTPFKRKGCLISQGLSPKELAHDRIDDDDELAGDGDDILQYRRAKRKSGPVDLTMDESPKRKAPEHNPISKVFIDFCVPISIETQSKRTRDHDQDELNDQEMQRKIKKARLQSKEASAHSGQDVVSRADIKPTAFSSSRTVDKTLSSLNRQHILKAFRGPHYLCEEEQFLKLETSASGPVLHAYQERDFKKQSPHYDWLVVNLAQLYKVSWNTHDFRIILDQRGTSLGGKPVSPSLFLQFSSSGGVDSLVACLKAFQGGKTDIEFKEIDMNILEKRFNHQSHDIRLAKENKMHRSPHDSQDILLLEHNQKRREVANGLEPRGESDRPQQASRKPKLIDELIGQAKPAVTDLDNEKRANGATSQPKQRALRSMQGRSYTLDLTQSLETDPRSPSPKPKPKLWTEENPGWDKEWRVDLSQFRTTIHKGDIGRLEEGELLNDSIISFYLQYLHEAVRNKDANVARRFYFQSSFFWDRLKSTPNKKGINYEKVKSWTNRVDLFSYDYIVVPVNENSHWYMAVICNPGRLLPADEISQETTSPSGRPQHETRASADEAGLPQSGPISNEASQRSPEGLQVTISSNLSPGTEMSDNLGRLSLGKPTQETKDDVKAISIDDDEEVCPSSTRRASVSKNDEDDEICLITSDVQPQRKPGKTSGKGPDAKDRDVDRGSVKSKDSPMISGSDPCIITFDSLGSSHSPVCTALKKYLEHEAKHRKGLDIEMPNMGRTAKNIPLQDNYWDCGVFLMSYVEALMRNPEDFIRKVLSRKAGAADEGSACTVDAVAMRRLIRSTILEQQIIYQKKVEDEAEAKRARKLRKAQGSASTGSGACAFLAPGPEREGFAIDRKPISISQAFTQAKQFTATPDAGSVILYPSPWCIQITAIITNIRPNSSTLSKGSAVVWFVNFIIPWQKSL